MARIKRYKIARRLGPEIFEKTQGEKFALRESRRKVQKGKKRRGNVSGYGTQLLEKQKVRFMYGVNERQFARYIKEASSKEGAAAPRLFASLETRLDNVAYRMGFAPTRLAARQMVSHGHITVNGRKMRIPSHRVRVGDMIAIREQSKTAGIFNTLDESMKETKQPSWIHMDADMRGGKIASVPLPEETSLPFDLVSVIEFYSR